MTEFSFSDKDLQLAAGKVRSALLESLPAPSDCTHEFSDSFLEKMEVVVQQDRRHQARKTFLLRIAAVFLALLIGAGALFAFSPEVRAAVTQWVREVYENSILYRFIEEKESSSIPDYEVGWLPKGYEESDVYKDDDLISAIYENEAGESIIINLYSMQNGTIHEMIYQNGTEYAHKKITINGMPADYYEVPDHSDSNDLVVFYEMKKVVLHINGFLDKESMIHIAESICFK
jgi:hypothetical protein